MIHSMTGFARRELREPWGSISWELRSINHRYLETGLRIPEALRPMEHGFRKAIGQHLKRGKIDGQLRLRWSSEVAGAIDKKRDRRRGQNRSIRPLSLVRKQCRAKRRCGDRIGGVPCDCAY